MADIRGADAAPPPGWRAWTWVPTVYFVSGAPYVLVNTVSGVLFADLGYTNTQIGAWTSWFYLPWVIKPLWSPLVDALGTKRRWVVGTQLALAAGAFGLAGAATVSGAAFLPAAVVAFGLMALASATHDVAADGFYLLALPPTAQAAFVGIRSTAYRLAMMAGEGGLLVLVGALAAAGGAAAGWAGAFGVAGVALGSLSLLHAATLPTPAADGPVRDADALASFVEAFRTFFAKPGIARALPFLLLYRFAEAQLVKMMGPFLLADRAAGGLGLTTGDIGWSKGTVGLGFLVLGGVLGGLAIARHGLRRWLWPMVAALHLPDLVFLAFAWWQPTDLRVVTAGLAVEQFGYGFGFTAYTMFLVRLADGPRKTTHYAIGTGLMALGMMVPGWWSGKLADELGWVGFFTWVALSIVPSAAVVALVDVRDPSADTSRPAGA
jgi:PAT family beta-lactamase induction signal transducer AmpG